MRFFEKAKEDFAKGEYQWVAQITNTLVFADPENTDARYLCADALEQIGISGRIRSNGAVLTFVLHRNCEMVQIPMMQREAAVTVMFSHI